MSSYSKVFSASLDSMESILKWIIGKIPSEFFHVTSQYLVELGIEEIIVNLIKHGYHDKPWPIFINLEISPKNTHITLRDIAPAFNILNHQLPPLEANIEKARVGGHGIKIIKTSFPEISYSHNEAMNILQITLSK